MGCGCGGGCGKDEVNTNLNDAPCDTSPVGQAVSSCCNQCKTPNSAVPFYAQARAVQESHTLTVVQEQYVTGITIANTFNIPACSATAVLVVPGLQRIIIGSYLWNPNYGYLKVISFDPANSMVVVENTCVNGPVLVGTAVPSCTLFTVVDTPVPSSTFTGPATLYPFLAVDFTAPADGNCIDIQVTNVHGLSIGNVISINGGSYTISAVTGVSQITICNHGLGVTPGTTVPAKDSNGNYIQPIVLSDVNPCGNTAINAGDLLVCHGGLLSPLHALYPGMSPVSTGNGNEVEMVTLDIPPRDCTTLTACLNLITGTASYTLVVADSSLFHTNDVIQIDNSPGRLTITSVPNPTHIIGTYAPVPAADVTYPEGTLICQATCCEQLDNRIDTDIANRRILNDNAINNCTAPTNVNTNHWTNPGAGQATDVYTLQRTISNTSIYPMYASILIKWNVSYKCIDTAGTNQFAHMRWPLRYAQTAQVIGGGAGYPAPVALSERHRQHVQLVPSVDPTGLLETQQWIEMVGLTIPPNHEVLIAIDCQLIFYAGTMEHVNVVDMSEEMILIGWAYRP